MNHCTRRKSVIGSLMVPSTNHSFRNFITETPKSGWRRYLSRDR
ncbi:unnamed protein product [Chondrus crispus]|uniref:Uncharacterized protein n=1 Tax=Chondrus crispus TaxID=2769 RepID=R7QUR5_CHOCR|nr:unnamed protein product [Chondrus crispus]CDF41080.1 unnamed protein product [Chondrus crispus]|eukprot:XP_005711374.1 unnamed protein product [Chondrus crispus]